MQNFLTYILEVSILTSIFFLFYRYLYYKLAYFVWSRYFFYLILFASLIIPILPSFFSTDLLINKVGNIINNNSNFINIENSFLLEKEVFFQEIKFKQIIFIIWVSGFIRYSFLIAKSILSIIFLIKKGNKKKDGKYTIVSTESDNPAFSFFNYIFVATEFNQLQQADKEQIIKHEKIHAKQKHTIDNLVFEFFRAVFWFNPISKSISINLKIIHEFIVDNVLTGNKNVPDYSKLIVKMASQKTHGFAISNFSNEEIKSRINLITFPEKEKIRKKHFAISIPILLVTIIAMWFITSSINLYTFSKLEQKKEFSFPFDEGTYKIISPYFKKQKINGLQVSHKEISYELKSFSNIYSIEKGKITSIKENDIFGLKEYTITEKLQTGQTIIYKGIFKTKLMKNDIVEKGKLIGISGDLRLYPKLAIKVLVDDVAINPNELY